MNTAEARKNWDKIQIGWWYTICCEHELTRILDEPELTGMVQDLRNPQIILPDNFGVWPTKEEALAALREQAGDQR